VNSLAVLLKSLQGSLEECNEAVHTFGQIFKTDIVKLFHLLHFQFLLVDLDNKRRATCVSTSKAELAKRIFERLRNVYSIRVTLGDMELSASSDCLAV